MLKLCRMIAAVLLLALLCGCRNTNARSYTLPVGEPIPGYEDRFYKPTFTTLEAYDQFLAESYIPEGYISYHDIAFVGEFCEYRLNTDDDLENLHDRAFYLITDASGCRIAISISKQGSFAGYFDDEAEYENLDGIRDFRYAPEYPPEDAEHASYSKTYKYGDIKYTYDGLGKDIKPALRFIDWKFGDYYITVAKGDTTVMKRDELGRPVATVIEYLNSYPEIETDTFVGRLLNPKTAQGAVDQLNFFIWWANFREELIQWLPMTIFIMCVAAVGTGYLIIRRKWKKTAAESTAQKNESKIEE